MPLVNNDMDFFVGIDAQLGKYATHLGERVVGGHDFDGGMTCDILSDLFRLIAFPVDSQQQIAMLMDLVQNQIDEGDSDDSVSGLLYSKGGGSTTCDALVQYTVDGNLFHSIFKIGGSLWSLNFVPVVHNLLITKLL